MRQETRRLYLEDPYQVEFEAKVVEKTMRRHKPALILDQTCFYPESGGQVHDSGWINGVSVLEVVEDGEKIVHVLEKEVTTDTVKGIIDRKSRFDHMQQHTGQHILSQSFYELFEAETLSFHMGKSSSTIEIDMREISERKIGEVERRANDVVFENRVIKIHSLREDKVHSLPLRKPTRKKGLIRVVEVANFDYSACGGTHVGRTGEVGLIKILKWERIRNNLRFEFVCGQRAVEDYAWKDRILGDLSNRLSSHQRDILSSVERLFSDLKAQRRANKKLQEKISQYEALEFVARQERIIKEVFTERTREEMKSLALNIIRKGDFVVLFGLKGEERGHLVLACSENLKIDMRELVPLISPLVKGRGGGSPSLVEMAVEDVGKIDLALEKAREKVGSDL